MRAGTSNTGAGQAIVNQAPATPSPVTVEAAGVQKSNMQENLEQANGGYGSIMWFLLLGALYLFFDWFQTRDKIAGALEPSNMRANAHHIVIAGMAAILFYI